MYRIERFRTLMYMATAMYWSCPESIRYKLLKANFAQAIGANTTSKPMELFQILMYDVSQLGFYEADAGIVLQELELLMGISHEFMPERPPEHLLWARLYVSHIVYEQLCAKYPELISWTTEFTKKLGSERLRA